MSNTIVIELCAEDRARLDRLAEAMEKRACDRCVTSALDAFKAIQEKPTETLAKANEAVETPKNAVEEAETPAPTTEPQEEEKPTAEEPANALTEPTVTHADLMAKVIEISAKSIKHKAQAREIVLSYAERVKAVPADKLDECYAKLVALEG